MKGHKLNISSTELLRMREDNLMNDYDIADALDISVTSVRRSIGTCPRSIGGILSHDAYCKKRGIGPYGKVNNKSTKKSDKPSVPKLPSYKPNVCEEKYNVCNNLYVDVDYDAKIITIGDAHNNGVFINFKDIPDVIQFLAWLSRERLEFVITENEE